MITTQLHPDAYYSEDLDPGTRFRWASVDDLNALWSQGRPFVFLRGMVTPDGRVLIEMLDVKRQLPRTGGYYGDDG